MTETGAAARSEATSLEEAGGFEGEVASAERAFVKRGGSFRRYQVAAEPGDARPRSRKAGLDPRSWKTLEKSFFEHRFRSIDAAGAPLSSVGWTGPGGRTPRDPSEIDPQVGRVLCLWLRMDVKRIPAGALKVRRMEAEARERAEVSERIGPDRRREIRTRIEQELLARVVPGSAVHQVLWDTASGLLLFSSTAEAANAAFRGLFRDTVGRAAQPLDAVGLAAHWARSQPREPDLGVEDLPSPGSEFLLWLWSQCETAGGSFDLGDVGRVDVAFDRLLELKAPDESGGLSLRGDLPTRSAEADSALKAGKLPTLAHLILAHGDRTDELTLDAARFELRGLKRTASGDQAAEDAGDRITRQVEDLLAVPRMLEGLYARFLGQRLAEATARTLVERTRQWIRARSAGAPGSARSAARSVQSSGR